VCWREWTWTLEGLRVPFRFVSDSPSFSLAFELADDCKASSRIAYPQFSSVSLDGLFYDMTIILNQCLSHPSFHPSSDDRSLGYPTWT
jgi:hypothetical protein